MVPQDLHHGHICVSTLCLVDLRSDVWVVVCLRPSVESVITDVSGHWHCGAAWMDPCMGPVEASVGTSCTVPCMQGGHAGGAQEAQEAQETRRPCCCGSVESVITDVSGHWHCGDPQWVQWSQCSLSVESVITGTVDTRSVVYVVSLGMGWV